MHGLCDSYCGENMHVCVVCVCARVHICMLTHLFTYLLMRSLDPG